ncbi:MAG: MFS family permease [Myxococcota bacterium]
MEPPKQAVLWSRGLILLTLAHFLMAVGFGTMLLFPLYATSLGAGRGEVGVIMATAGLSGLLTRPLVGWALDRWGRKPTIAVGTFWMAAGMWLVALVGDLGPAIYLQRAVFGVGLGALFTAYFTFAADLVPASRRTEGIALFGIAGLAPLALNPFVGDLGIEAADLRGFYPWASIVVVVSLAFVWLVPETVRPTASVVGHSRRKRLLAASKTLVAGPLLPVWLATLIFATAVSVFFAFSTVTADTRGVARSADLWLTYAGGAACVRLFGSRLPDRLGPTKFVPPALLFYIAGLAVCVYAASSGAFMVAGLLAGIGHGYCFPVLTSLVVARAPDALRGSAMSLYTALWVVAELTMTPLFGVVGDATSDATMFAVAVGLCLTGLVAWRLVEGRLGAPTAQSR